MKIGRHTSENTEVCRCVPRRLVAKALVWLGTGITVLALGQPASAIPAISLRFTSQTVVADGVNPTPVQILVQVVNTGTGVGVVALDSQLTWTVTGTAISVGDLALIEDSGQVSGAGFLFNGASPILDSQGTNVPPANWGISAIASRTISTGTTNVARLDLEIAPTTTSGQFIVNFVTGTPFNTQFTGSDFTTAIPYANGNNGTTFGVITVIPEPSTGTALGAATILMAGVGVVQRKMRRRRSAEIAG